MVYMHSEYIDLLVMKGYRKGDLFLIAVILDRYALYTGSPITNILKKGYTINDLSSTVYCHYLYFSTF